MNSVLIEHIKHLSESKTKFEIVKKKVSNWRAVIIVSILTLTLKVAAEQLIMLIRSN